MIYPDIYHIGCLKTGTSTLQSYIAQDNRINVIFHSRFFNTSKWYSGNYTWKNPVLINIESDENISRKIKNMVGLEESLKRIRSVAPDSKIILTIREQRSIIISMYKHFIRETNSCMSIDEFIVSPEGLSFIETVKYHDVYMTIKKYFHSNKIYVYFFENMINNWDGFIQQFYTQVFNLAVNQSLGITKRNEGLKDNEVITKRFLNSLNFFQKNTILNKIHNRIFIPFFLPILSNSIFYNQNILWENINTHKNLEEIFQDQNSRLEKTIKVSLPSEYLNTINR